MIKKRIRSIAISSTAAALVITAVTGCGQARSEDPVQKQSESATAAPQTEAAPAVTEAPIVIETEAPQVQSETQPQTQVQSETQPQTQVQVQSETQPQTQPETQPQTAPATLSEEEELAQLYEFAEGEVGTKFANADMNVRTSPSTSSDDNIVSSLDKGEEVTIVGETANWYEIYKAEDSVSGLTDLKAFVMKSFMSDTYDEAMAAQPEESAPAAEAAPAEAAPAEAAPAEAAPAEAAPAEAAPAQAATPETTAPAQQVAASSASGPAVTIKSDANIRADASEVGEVVGVVTAGTTVTQIGSTDGWVQVDYNGVQGYVKASMVG